MANLSEIIWSCEITWQTRQLYLQYHNIYGHHPTVQDSDFIASTHKVNNPLVTWFSRSRDKLKPLWLHYNSPYGYQTFKFIDLP